MGMRSYAGYQEQGVPEEYLSSTAPRAFNCELRQKVVQSQTGTIGASSRMVFSIPTGENSFLRGGTAYISCLVSITKTADAVVTWRKSRLGNATIRACQLTANGVLVSRLDQADDVNALMYCHAGSQQYYANDATVMEGGIGMSAVGNADSIQLFIPVPLGILNSSSIPLFALPNNNLLLEIETNTIANMFKTDNVNNSVSAVTFANCQLIYESIQVDASFVRMLKDEMAKANAPWIIPYSETRCFAQSGGDKSIVLGLNLSSVDAVFVQNYANPADTTSQTSYIAPSANAGSNKFDVLCDGVRVNQYLRDEGIKFFPDMNLALSKLYDVACVSTSYGSALTRANYLAGAFAGGQNLRKSYSKSTVLNGRPVNSLQLDLAGFAEANLVISVFHTSLCQIDPATGVVTLIR